LRQTIAIHVEGLKLREVLVNVKECSPISADADRSQSFAGSDRRIKERKFFDFIVVWSMLVTEQMHTTHELGHTEVEMLKLW
jgi:hypothetical protein